jgi:hypothetical protein
MIYACSVLTSAYQRDVDEFARVLTNLVCRSAKHMNAVRMKPLAYYSLWLERRGGAADVFRLIHRVAECDGCRYGRKCCESSVQSVGQSANVFLPVRGTPSAEWRRRYLKRISRLNLSRGEDE